MQNGRKGFTAKASLLVLSTIFYAVSIAETTAPFEFCLANMERLCGM
jgi:hypothetical protein